jgi:adenosylcobinamide-phosphate synthase
MGKYLTWLGHGLTDLRPLSALWRGAFYWFLGAVFFAALYAVLAYVLSFCVWWLELMVTAILLKPLFAFRMLLNEAREVEKALLVGLESGRKRLSVIVSRNTAILSEVEVRESVLESLSENLSDSVVAPLFWYLLLGLPGAALYRFVNTADAMWGYRGIWEWAGKVAARSDDIMNYVPARLTALMLFPVYKWRYELKHLVREAALTPSPNSGYPMSALALYLQIRLSKPGVYTLNVAGNSVSSQDVTRALQHCARVGWGFGVGCALMIGRMGW